MRILIVDGNWMLHRSMKVSEVAELENHQGNPTGGIYGTLRSLHATLCRFRARKCIVVYDGGISKRRRRLFPEYKGARYRDRDDPLFEPMDEKMAEYVEKFDWQRIRLLWLFPRLGVHVLRLPGWEADDVIAALCAYYEELKVQHLIHIMSDDKDMLQLVRETDTITVNVYRAIAKQLVTVNNFEQIFGCDQQTYELRRIILGDPGSDNISGIDKVGKKTIKDMSEEAGFIPYNWPFIELHDFCAQHENWRVRLIADSIDIVMRNNDLMCLSLEDWSELWPIFQKELCKSIEIDMLAVQRLLTKLDMFSILEEFHTWLVPWQRLVK